jgi:hypothetical protein
LRRDISRDHRRNASLPIPILGLKHQANRIACGRSTSISMPKQGPSDRESPPPEQTNLGSGTAGFSRLAIDDGIA